MRPEARPTMTEIGDRLCALTREQVGELFAPRVHLDATLVDLDLDSLDSVEWIMEIEEVFSITIPESSASTDQAYKQVLVRDQFCLRDMVELIHMRWGSGAGSRSETPTRFAPPPGPFPSFTQLGGRLEEVPEPLFLFLGDDASGRRRWRRMTDGMVCIELPGGAADIGSDLPSAGPDEGPVHRVDLAAFLIDSEAVSVTAYCRFLNSIGDLDEATLRAWFLILPDERRFEHQVIERLDAEWRPKPGTETWPMILLSWHGAHAYALWAAGSPWRQWQDDTLCFLPSEAEWEYAARGAKLQDWPWGDRPPVRNEINAGFVRPDAPMLTAADLPLWPVHVDPAPSAFGLRLMAGNVWEWCRDWYHANAYTEAARGRRIEEQPSGVRSERGGSWVGPLSLTRSSYRRARAPEARGRCLGFRCVHPRRSLSPSGREQDSRVDGSPKA
jgi:acyl carrier protein